MTTITRFPAGAVIVTLRTRTASHIDRPRSAEGEALARDPVAPPRDVVRRPPRCATILILRGDPDVVVPFPRASGRRRRRDPDLAAP
ncbi:MAG: hypothetical protein ABTQ29_10590 [Siculibacillus sp.]